MRNFNEVQTQQNYKIIAVDDEKAFINSLSTAFKGSEYQFTGVTNPREAIELIKNEHFDLLMLDFLMPKYHGEQVVEEVRKFNKDLSIWPFTGHKDVNSSTNIFKKFDIDEYDEKENKFDQLVSLMESGIKSIKQMQKINGELSGNESQTEKDYLESIESLCHAVEAKDKYTKGHSDRVAELAVLIGKKMGLSETESKTLRTGALFHDIGKIGIPDSILMKKARLTDEEYSKIKQHPSIGAYILSNADIFKDIIPIVKYHHERFDGKGYPKGLKGEEIPLLARITAVVDSFDAMFSKRIYRDGLGIDVIGEEIMKNRGTQFDPEIADVFLEILQNDDENIRRIQELY